MYDHVVLISIDTLRSDVIGANPHKLWPTLYPGLTAPDTAILDEIVGAGTFFPVTHSAAPYTSASHASYFSGLWPTRHGVYEFFNRPLGAETLFTWARRQGYRTHFKVDFPIILGSFLGFDRDVDEYIVEDDDRYLAALADSDRSVDFVHFGGLHIPYGFHNLTYGGDDYRQTVAALEAEIGEQPGSLADHLVETYRDPEDLDLMLRYKRIVQHHYQAGHHERLFGLYLAGAEHFLRTRFTRFFRQLQSALAGKRSLIVVFGDHGEQYDADTYGHFNAMAEGVLRVPVVFVGDGVSAGVRHDGRVRTIDVAPTLLELLGWPAPDDLDGTSLAPILRGEEAGAPREAYAQAYISDTHEFVAYQKRLLDGGDRPGDLRHVLFREAAYQGPFRLVRQGFDWGLGGKIEPIPPRMQLERLGADLAYHPLRRVDLTAQLAAALDAYSQSMSPAQPLDEIPDTVRQQLADMGYRV